MVATTILDYEIVYYANSKWNNYSCINFNFTGNKNTKRSNEGNIFFIANRPVFWKTKYQETLAISIVKVEYMAFTHTTQQTFQPTKYFDKVGLSIIIPVVIWTENNGSISNSTNDKNYYNTKYIDIKYHFVK